MSVQSVLPSFASQEQSTAMDTFSQIAEIGARVAVVARTLHDGNSQGDFTCLLDALDDLGRLADRVREMNGHTRTTSVRKRGRAEPVPEMAFGAEWWEKCFGDVGVEPPLPEDIEKILDSPCPIWPGKRIRDTHVLVLVPETVNAIPLSLNTLGKLVSSPKPGYKPSEYRNTENVLAQSIGTTTLGDRPAGPSHWVLMTKSALPGSTNEPLNEQKRQIGVISKTAGTAYQYPTLLDAVTCIFMHKIRYPNVADRLYGSPTLIRCQEQVRVGCFTMKGLLIGATPDETGQENLGVSAVRLL